MALKEVNVSPPFNLSAGDWQRIGAGAVLAVFGALGAYLTAVVLPALSQNVANEWGSLIIAGVTAILPILANIVKKFLTTTLHVVDDTPQQGPPPSGYRSYAWMLAILSFLTVLVLPGLLMAQTPVPGPVPNISVWLQTLLGGLFNGKDPMMLVIVLLGVMLFTSKVLKIDLSTFILPLVTSLLKPNGPVVPVVPGPVVIGPGPTPQPMDFLMQLIMQLLTARQKGDLQTEQATVVLLTNALEAKRASAAPANAS